MLSSHDLATLIAVADAGSIHGAALKLYRTQPAVTQAIQRLEDAVGFALLDRSGYRVKLTERGATFVSRARGTLQQAQALAAFAGVLSQGVEPRVRVALHGALPNALALRLTRGVVECFPDTTIELQTGEVDAPLDALQADSCQLALVIHPQHVTPDIEHKQVGELTFVSVAHHTCGADERVLAALPQVIVSDFSGSPSSYGVVTGQRAWRVSDHRMKVDAIVAGCGWGSVPRHLVADLLNDGVLVPIAYRGLQPSSRHPVVLCRKRDRVCGPVATMLWDALTISAAVDLDSSYR